MSPTSTSRWLWSLLLHGGSPPLYNQLKWTNCDQDGWVFVRGSLWSVPELQTPCLPHSLSTSTWTICQTNFLRSRGRNTTSGDGFSGLSSRSTPTKRSMHDWPAISRPTGGHNDLDCKPLVTSPFAPTVSAATHLITNCNTFVKPNWTGLWSLSQVHLYYEPSRCRCLVSNFFFSLSFLSACLLVTLSATIYIPYVWISPIYIFIVEIMKWEDITFTSLPLWKNLTDTKTLSCLGRKQVWVSSNHCRQIFSRDKTSDMRA